MNSSTITHRINPAACLLFTGLVLWAAENTAVAYGLAEHLDIGGHARDNYAAYVEANPDTSVGACALTRGGNWGDIAWGLDHEDDGFRSLNHFWDPYTGLGLSKSPLPGNYDSAETTAENYWNSDELFPAYREGGSSGNYQLAYRTLGRVAHLVMDMGVPAHVNLDPHLVSDHYETDYVTTPGHRIHATTIAGGDDLHGIMYNIACQSRQFDSDDRDGLLDQGTRRAGGITDDECTSIVQVCYPGAEEAAGAVFKLFYDTIKPGVLLLRPTQGQIHSGLIGVPLSAVASSYGKEYTDADFIQQVVFSYAAIDNPVSSSWVCCGEDDYFDAACCYTVNWLNNIDDDVVWVRAIAWDDADCESLADKTWIRIDSTRPTVTNIHP